MQPCLYIEHPERTYKGEPFPDAHKGFIVSICAQAHASNATVADGYGYGLWATGNWYEGEFKGGKTEGRGKHTWANGKFTWASGNVYEGEWKGGMMEGRGKYTYADGNVYEGEWKADKKEGRGKYTYANGNFYEGEWKADKRKGRGKYTYATGNDAACCCIG